MRVHWRQRPLLVQDVEPHVDAMREPPGRLRLVADATNAVCRRAC